MGRERLEDDSLGEGDGDELTGTGLAPDPGAVTLTSGVTLDAEQLATVLGALAGAQAYRREHASQSRDDCEACNDLDAASEHEALAARLLGGGAR